MPEIVADERPGMHSTLDSCHLIAMINVGIKLARLKIKASILLLLSHAEDALSRSGQNFFVALQRLRRRKRA